MTDPGKVYVDSAGTAGYHLGKKPDPRSIAVARTHGIDISEQRCRQFSKEDFDAFDRIYTMDLENMAQVLALAPSPEAEKKVRLLLDDLAREGNEVPDPYYGGEQGFEHVFHLISEACEKIRHTLDPENNPL